MSTYKVVFKADHKTAGPYALTWEPECPIQITAVQVSRNVDSSATFLQVKVRNVSSENVSSIAVELEAHLTDDKTARTSLEYLDVDIAPAAERVLKPRQLSHANITACKLAIARIGDSKGIWQSTGSAKPRPTRKELQLSPKAFAQRARSLGDKAGDLTIKGAVQDHGTWWVCACGQANVNRDTCCACGSKKKALIENENEIELLKKADAYSERIYKEATGLAKEGAKPDDLRKAISLLESVPDWKDAGSQTERYREKLTEKETAQHKKTRKITIATVSALAGVAAIIALAVFAVIPVVQYGKAAQLVDEADFEAAVDLASKIGGIKSGNAQSLKEEAQYQYAVGNLNRGSKTTYEYLKELSAKNYEDSGALFDEYFSPKVEIALVPYNDIPTENDWSSSPVIAEMWNTSSNRVYGSNVYDIWIRAYCPIENTLETTVDISTYAQYGSKAPEWVNENASSLFGTTNKHTFHPGTNAWCMSIKHYSQTGLRLSTYSSGRKDISARVMVKNEEGETLCEKELQLPNYL